MEKQRRFGNALMAGLLIVLSGVGFALTFPYPDSNNSNAAGQEIIIDHTSTDITAVPQTWIEEAKRDLHIAYGHTSHSGQLTDGMAGLVGFANNGGLGLSLPQNIFQFSPSGNAGGAICTSLRGLVPLQAIWSLTSAITPAG